MNQGKVRTDVMTWQGMYGNGVMTGMMEVIIVAAQQITRKGRQVGRTVFCAAVAGSTILATAFLLIGASTTALRAF